LIVHGRAARAAHQAHADEHLRAPGAPLFDAVDEQHQIHPQGPAHPGGGAVAAGVAQNADAGGGPAVIGGLDDLRLGAQGQGQLLVDLKR